MCFFLGLVPGVYHSSVRLFPLPKQSIVLSVPHVPVTQLRPAILTLEGAVNVEGEEVFVDGKGKYVFGTKTDSLLRRYRCTFSSLLFQEEKVVVTLTVLNFPLTVVLERR